ncbi:MAG: beta-lactamase family protein [Burkholderiales bacterium]|nr:beta-lactamase family protein [Burkholderiales bacterium]
MSPAAFQPLHAALQAQVRGGFLPGVSTALLRGREVVDRFVCGQADIETNTPLREDHLFRVFSNTKLVTSCAVLLLVEQGRLGLDDPIERYLPELGQRQVLRPGATRIDEVEPARRPITVRHLMTHTAGLSYGLFNPGTLLNDAYRQASVHRPTLSNAQLVTELAQLPLAFHPGEQWEYSLATDVLGRLIEVVSGDSLGHFFSRYMFEPLDMADTAFRLSDEQFGRLAGLYVGMDRTDPTVPGLKRLHDVPYPGAYRTPDMREGGGGGLISSLGDMVRLIQALMPGGPGLLKPHTLADMGRNQLPPGVCVRFPDVPLNPGRVFGLGSAVLARPGPLDPPVAEGEVNWGGMAGTVWWINPRLNIAGVLMTQRYWGSGDPYALEFKRLAYQGLGH